MSTIASNNAKSNKNGKNEQARKNEQIRSDEVMVIDADGEKLGIMELNDALQRAYDANMDLVEVSPNAQPPVCRIMDYGKYLYERQKKEKANKRASKQRQLKEMKFRCGIGEGDYETKKKHIVRFIEAGSPVRITIMFRGREMSHPEIGMEILDKLAGDLEEICNVQVAPKMEGRNMTMTVVPKK